MRQVTLPQDQLVLITQHDVQRPERKNLSIVVVHDPEGQQYICWVYSHAPNWGRYCSYHNQNTPEGRAIALDEAMRVFTERVARYEAFEPALTD